MRPSSIPGAKENGDARFNGIPALIIYRDGKEIARVGPGEARPQAFAQFQGITFHDTPQQPVPAMRWTDAGVPAGPHAYTVSAVNGAGRESPRSAPA